MHALQPQPNSTNDTEDLEMV